MIGKLTRIDVSEVRLGPATCLQNLRNGTLESQLHHFTRLDQVTQLVRTSEAEADVGFMARLLALCSLPRTNPGDRRVHPAQRAVHARDGRRSRKQAALRGCPARC